jgi:antitoxin component of MazEF toxin-antitoxin module
MPLTKRLTPIGNSRGLILDKAILQQADMSTDTEVEISVEDHAIVIRPHRYASDAEASAAGKSVMQRRRKLMERLAK